MRQTRLRMLLSGGLALIVGLATLAAAVALQGEWLRADAAGSMIDDTSSSIGWKGWWVKQPNASAIGGFEHVVNGPGASATLAFTGSQIKLYYTQAADRAIARVTIDGAQKPDVDQYGPLAARKTVNYSLAPGNHTIVVTNAGGHNPLSQGWWIGIDAFEIAGGGAMAGATATATATPTRAPASATPTPTQPPPSPATKTATPAVAATAGPSSLVTIDDGDARIRWSGYWLTRQVAGALGGTERIGGGVGASATLAFTGGAVTVYYATGPQRAYLDVTIDGVARPRIDQYAATLAPKQTVTYPLAHGAHTIVLTNAGGRNLASTGWETGLDALGVGDVATPTVVASPATVTPTATPTTATSTASPTPSPTARPAQAGGVVTACGNDAQLTALIAGGGAISFDCGGVGAAATIALASTKAIAAGAAVSIDGGGRVALSGGGQRRLFDVAAGASLALADLTLRDGRAFGGGAIRSDGAVALTRVSLVNNVAAGGFGGAISSTGSVTIGASTFADNVATDGYGGAIDSALAGSLVAVADSAFARNTAKLGGGAIASNGEVRVSGSAFADNVAGAGHGGGAIESTGPLTVTASVFSGNRAGKGGAVYNEGGVATLVNSTLTGNAADAAPRTGGGVHNQASHDGQPGRVTIVAGTLADNAAPGGQGGNLYNAAGAGNAVEVRRTIVSGGAPGNCAGGVSSGGDNLDSGTGCGFAGAGDRAGAEARLGPLAANGGPTATRALGAGSAALDAVGAGRCLDAAGAPLAADQRGAARPQDGDGDGLPRCDIGAFER